MYFQKPFHLKFPRDGNLKNILELNVSIYKAYRYKLILPIRFLSNIY